jgi:hypothetical protein
MITVIIACGKELDNFSNASIVLKILKYCKDYPLSDVLHCLLNILATTSRRQTVRMRYDDKEH